MMKSDKFWLCCTFCLFFILCHMTKWFVNNDDDNAFCVDFYLEWTFSDVFIGRK